MRLSDYHIRTFLWQPACYGHDFSLALADESPLVFGRPQLGSVRLLGYRYSDGALAVPWVTLLVATTFSPCPLAQEWKHRILRSPHDTGQVGTSPDAPF